MSINFGYLINNTLSENVAIDLGTHMTSVYIQNKGIVFNEPSYIAVDTRTNEIIALGEEAYMMLGKNPANTKIINPIENGVVSDIEMTVKMLRAYLSKVYKKTVLKPRIITSIRSDMTEIQRHAIANVLKDVGARTVYTLDAPLSAAIGAGCDISLARGLFIVHIGAGYSDIASISLGQCVVHKSIDTAGNSLTNDIIKYIRKNHNLNIGFLTAEAIKQKIGCAYSFDKITSINVSGCDATSGIPRFISVTSEEIKDCLQASVLKIAATIKSVLKDTPPELQSDILEDGILLTGGGAMLYGLDKFLRMNLEIKVFSAENMQDCVINGIGAELTKLDLPNAQGGKFYHAAD